MIGVQVIFDPQSPGGTIDRASSITPGTSSDDASTLDGAGLPLSRFMFGKLNDQINSLPYPLMLVSGLGLGLEDQVLGLGLVLKDIFGPWPYLVLET